MSPDPALNRLPLCPLMRQRNRPPCHVSRVFCAFPVTWGQAKSELAQALWRSGLQSHSRAPSASWMLELRGRERAEGSQVSSCKRGVPGLSRELESILFIRVLQQSFSYPAPGPGQTPKRVQAATLSGGFASRAESDGRPCTRG